MNTAPEISFHGVERNEDIENLISQKVAKLERACGYISSCRVAVEQPPHHRRTGNPYRVRIELGVPPGHSVVVAHESAAGKTSAPLSAVIREAFEVSSRRLKKLVEVQRGAVKTHPEEQDSLALVYRLFPDEGYGFLKTLQGDELYFHRRSVLNDDFDRLALGTSVRFVDEEGEEGRQASTVEIMDKPGVRATTPAAPDAPSQPPLGWR